MSSSDSTPEPQGADPAPSGAFATPVGRASRDIWWTRRALGLHVTLVLVVPTFVALFWWQVQRVREGNTLSWAYVFEWPFFTGYAVYLWWRLVHDQADESAPLGSGLAAGRPTAVAAQRQASSSDVRDVDGGAEAEDLAGDGEPDGEDGEDEKLAAYNRYLAELHSSGRRKRW